MSSTGKRDQNDYDGNDNDNNQDGDHTDNGTGNEAEHNNMSSIRTQSNSLCALSAFAVNVSAPAPLNF